MPIEMLQSSSNNYSSSSSLSSSKAQQRKERSCKGKRYLEMLNENKLSKRSKNAPSSSNGEENGTSSNKNLNCPNNSSSKWVTSGGFDLEEHIAALPQLNDNHLTSVLDQSTKTTLKSNDHIPVGTIQSTTMSQQQEANNNILLNNNEHNLKKDLSSKDNSNKIDSADCMDTTGNSNKQPNENSNVNENRRIDSQMSNSSTDLAEKIVERLNINSQSLECDGLAALAEVACSKLF